MSTLRAPAPSGPGLATSLRLKLHMSEKAREAVTTQFLKQARTWKANRKWDFAMGMLTGVVLTLTTLGIVGAL